jgi:mono/diheme cytochrome c family protein
MRTVLTHALLAMCILVMGCSDAATNTPPNDVPVTPPDGASMTEGEAVYMNAVDGGNVFACNTCHALQEPSVDGIRRVGHALGDATRRPSWKNGKVATMLEAVNSCLSEWMNVPEPWKEADKRWQALYKWLDGMGGEGDAPPVNIQISPPPDDLSGGNPEAGQALFNQSCTMCHGNNAAGGCCGPPLAGTGLEPDYIALRVRTSGLSDSPVYDGLTGGIMPFWGLDRLSDDELRDVVAFVSKSTITPPTEDVTDPPDTDAGGPPEDTATPPEDTATPPEDSTQPPDDTGTPIEDTATACLQTNAKVGWTTTLSTKSHNVKGNATIVDDCTIVITNFFFDGSGIDVRLYGAIDSNFGVGFAIGPQLFNFPVGYDNETLSFTLPEGKTMDDLNSISVWCVTVGISFGDGVFSAP